MSFLLTLLLAASAFPQETFSGEWVMNTSISEKLFDLKPAE